MDYLRNYLFWNDIKSNSEIVTAAEGFSTEILHSASASRMAGYLPLTRVELHSHLDGSVRAETVWELSRLKNLPLPGDGSLRALNSALVVSKPIDLAHFLASFSFIIPPLQDDLAAIERIAFEYIEDKAKDRVAYVEARFAPHGLLSGGNRSLPNLEGVVAAVSRGLSRGGEIYGVEWGLLLCTLAGWGTALQLEQLCERTRNLGVVGMDMACPNDSRSSPDEVPATGEELQAFQRAKLAGLFRTVHAGERGPAVMVKRAVELYGAQRIGHGYHVLEDAAVYEQVKAARIHLECCPWSSFLTGAVPLAVQQHPIVQFATDQANFSVSTDDTTVTGRNLTDDYKLFSSWGLTEAQAVRASLNAAASAFLPEADRQRLTKRILSQVVADYVDQ